MNSYLWWWAILLAIIVFVGWATGSAHTGAAVARYFAFSVLGVSLVILVASGFVELRLRSAGVIDAESLLPPLQPSLRRFLVACALFVSAPHSQFTRQERTGSPSESRFSACSSSEVAL